MENKQKSQYTRYHIQTELTPDIEEWPSRFNVDVKKVGLAKLLIKEVFHYKGKMDVILSRPCLYGVFSGPVGGFAPREQHCVGCLRCTTEFPEFVTVSRNPERKKLGDSYFSFDYVNAINYEAETGLVPVRGAGYGGKFGGQGWDGMWTDMSEIVRPTRDGIHGREFISTVVDIGAKPKFLEFNDDGELVGQAPQTFEIQVPFIFDLPPGGVEGEYIYKTYAQTASEIESLAIILIKEILNYGLSGGHVIPIIEKGDEALLAELIDIPRMIQLAYWNDDLIDRIQNKYPETLICLRIDFHDYMNLSNYVEKGIHVFHLVSNYHGRDEAGEFILDSIRNAHGALVDAGVRNEVTLIGSGGMIAAEHIPKAVLCGLDVVGLDTALMVALQGKFDGQCMDRVTSDISLPKKYQVDWGMQRLKNLAGSWRDQLLEIMGAMGLREVRRMKGEMGRAMFMVDLEAEAFDGIKGYDHA